jgi:hypothetical protein
MFSSDISLSNNGVDMSLKNSDSASDMKEFSGRNSISDENAEQRYVSLGSEGRK